MIIGRFWRSLYVGKRTVYFVGILVLAAIDGVAGDKQLAKAGFLFRQFFEHSRTHGS
jgi:hypothetical protein